MTSPIVAGEGPAQAGPELRRRRRRKTRSGRPRLSIIGLVGELFVTAGVLVFLFLGWQLWLNDLVVGEEQRSSALELSEQWGGADAGDGAPASEAPTDVDEPAPDYGDPVVATAPANGVGFATMYVPRFGADYVRAIGEGVGLASVLNNNELGIGHYSGTQMPGEVGNFALAAHRTTYGAPFNRIAELQQGDHIYVQTADGWFDYVFRSIEYVRPNGSACSTPCPRPPDSRRAIA